MLQAEQGGSLMLVSQDEEEDCICNEWFWQCVPPHLLAISMSIRCCVESLHKGILSVVREHLYWQ